MRLSTVVAIVAIATIEGALVALPRSDALERLGSLRSPIWGLVLPGSILVGTFGVLAVPWTAAGLVGLTCVLTPLLTAVAMIAVVRGPRGPLLLAAFALTVLALVTG